MWACFTSQKSVALSSGQQILARQVSGGCRFKGALFNLRRVLCRLAWYCLFLIFFALSQITEFQDRLIFESGASVDDALEVSSATDATSSTSPSFDQVESADDWYDYMENIFIPTVYPTHIAPSGLNGPSSVGMLKGQMPLVGAVRISQLRLQDTQNDQLCNGLSGRIPSTTGANLHVPCWGDAGHWRDALEDRRDFTLGLPQRQAAIQFLYQGGIQLVNSTDGTVRQAALPGSNHSLQLGKSFYSVAQEREFALGYGGLATEGNGEYPAPAYAVILPHPRSQNASARAAAAMQLLRRGSYISPGTRLVTVSLTVYSPTVDRFVSYTLYLEILATGNMYPGRTLRTARLFVLTQGRSGGDIFLEVAVACFFALFALEQVLLVCTAQEGLGILLTPDSALLVANIALYTATWMARIAAYYATPSLETIQWDADTYYGLAAASGLRQLALSFAAVNAFVCFFKLAHFLSELPQFALVTQTLYKAVRPICAFMVVFAVMFFGFAAAYLLVFGAQLQGYSNIRESSYSLMLSLMGDVPLSSLEAVSSWWGPVFTVTFVLICTFVVLNVFIAIVTEGYDEVKEQLQAARARTWHEDMGWYVADKLRQLPACGPTVDYRFRWCCSVRRAQRRVQEHNARMQQAILRALKEEPHANVIDDSGTNDSGTSAAELARLRAANEARFKETLRKPFGLLACSKALCRLCSCCRRAAQACSARQVDAAPWRKYSRAVHEQCLRDQASAIQQDVGQAKPPITAGPVQAAPVSPSASSTANSPTAAANMPRTLAWGDDTQSYPPQSGEAEEKRSSSQKYT